jgi:hypothetical protein
VPFPQTPLPVRVKIAPGAAPAGDPAGWVWQDITADVRVAAGITIETGRGDEAARVDPGKCTLTLDCRSGKYSSRNVLGPWYGRLGVNTPLRVSTVAVADTFTRTTSNGLGTADSGQAWTVDGPTADWSTNGAGAQLAHTTTNVVRYATVTGSMLADVDAQFTSSVPAVMTGASMVVGMFVRYVDTSNFLVLSTEYNPGGTVTAKIRRLLDGVYTELAALATVPALTYTGGTVLRTRVQADGPALRIKIWVDGDPEPDAWALTASDTTFLDAGLTGFYLWLVAGNTNALPFSVTLDNVDVEDVEFTGLVPEWPVRWDKSRKDSTTPIVASGVLRRLQQGKSPLRSPITRNFVRFHPVAQWPLEDGSGAKSAASLVPAAEAAVTRNVQFAADDTLPGAATTVGMTASSVLTGKVPRHTATGKWGCVFYAKLLAPPAATTRIMTVASSGTMRYWAVDLDSTTIRLRGYDVNGTAVVDTAVLYPTELVPPVWSAFDLYVSQTGGNVHAALIFHAVGIDTYYFTDATIAGNVGSPTGWLATGSLGFNGGRLAHVTFFNAEPSFVTGDFTAASNGYIGETASARIARLCAEEGVPVVVEPGDSSTLGPQRTDTFLNLLLAAEDADLGILYERGAGLAYRPRGARYNRPVELALDFDQDHIAEPPEPTDDDQRIRNRWTVTRDNGSEATAEDPASIAATTLYDEAKTINVETDDVLPDHAGWRLRLGTADELRWPKVDLNLAHSPHLIALWRRCGAFARLTIDNPPDQVAGNVVDVIVEGRTTVLGPFGWDVELNCSPAAPWQVAAVDDPTSLIDTDHSAINTAATDTATTLSVKVLDGPLWTTDPAHFPLDVHIGGIRATVTAITGTTSPQTFTVLRSVDGYDKALPVDTRVRLWSRTYIAL